MSDESAFGNLIGYRGRLGQRNSAQQEKNSVTRQSLYSLRPDPEQPRNLFGEATYQQRLWNGDDPRDVLQDWLATAESHAARKQSADSLRHLAATIAEYGLIQPITYRTLPSEMNAPNGVDKLIVTGERRWWAHVLLDIEDREIEGRLSADSIKAIALPNDAKIRGMQLIENLSREGLNAVERADGLNQLRVEMSAGRTKPIAWTEVEKRLGIDRTYRWRIQQVDKLSARAKRLIVENDLTENAIRPITANKALQSRPDLQETALQTLVAWQNNDEDSNNRRLTQHIAQLLHKEVEDGAAEVVLDYAAVTQKAISRISSAAKSLNRLDGGGRLYLANILAADERTKRSFIALHEQIETLLQEVNVVGRQHFE